jgi:formylglycine-generating enzyme required for sulfatase activity
LIFETPEVTLMPRFFICYRRDDSAYAAHTLCLAIQNRFGKDSVFIDVHSIPLGVDFREHIRQSVTSCDALLAMVGEDWIDAKNAQGERRLDDPRDFVRLEIGVALSNGIPVVPVVIDNARMPAEEQLPDELKPLAYRQSAELRPGADFPVHLERVVAGLGRFDGASRVPVSSPPSDSGKSPIVPGSSQLLPISSLDKESPPAQSLSQSSRTLGPMLMCTIRLREFQMGAGFGDSASYLEELPQHPVRFTQPIEMGGIPVTQLLFEEVMHSNPSKGVDPFRPVNSVTWYEAIEFCNRLSKAEGLPPYYTINEKKQVFRKGGNGFRLPTEAEWECACRSGSDGPRFCNLETLAEYAWYRSNSENRTHRVGRKEPNFWGLHDMLGNVWEWCYDWYLETYYSESPLVDPAGPTSGREKVLRGGSFGDTASVLRSSNRYQLAPHVRQDNVGFRIARTLEV